MKRNHTVWTMIPLLLLAFTIGCGDDEETASYYIRFKIIGTEYSLEKGVSGVNTSTGISDVTLDGLPGGYPIMSPGVYPRDIYATKSTIPIGNNTLKEDGMLKIQMNTNCLNTGIYHSVTIRYRHPGIANEYIASGQSVEITELGPVNSGVIAGTFSVTLTNATAATPILYLDSGTFRVKHLSTNSGMGLWGNEL